MSKKPKRKRQRKPITPQDRGVVGFIRCLNKFLLLPVPLLCLRYLSPEFTIILLNTSEHFLFSLGLNFRPTPRILSNHKQFDDFVRSVRTKYFFRDFTCTNVLSHQYSKLCVKSEQSPPLAPPWIELPLSAIKLELCSLRNHLNPNFSSNLSRSDFSALCKLCSIKGIRILAADKNLGPTIVTDSWYKLRSLSSSK